MTRSTKKETERLQPDRPAPQYQDVPLLDIAQARGVTFTKHKKGSADHRPFHKGPGLVIDPARDTFSCNAYKAQRGPEETQTFSDRGIKGKKEEV